ncbi:MAG: cytochrome c [Bacteroidetes bacterium]|nr:cytochrome c [Bacteroidota bacterium]
MKKPFTHTLLFLLPVLMLSLPAANAQDKPKGKEWAVPEKEAAKKSEIKFDANAVAAGKDLWAQNCKSCHGTKGLGDGSKAAKIDISCGDFSSKETQDISDGSLFWKITDGRKPMPSFSSKLTDAERWQLVAYIRTLKKAGSTSATTNKNTKDNSTPEKNNTAAKKDTTATGPEYLELKNEIDLLRKDMKALNSKVDSLKEEWQKK